jgi:hypothetical protein
LSVVASVSKEIAASIFKVEVTLKMDAAAFSYNLQL